LYQPSEEARGSGRELSRDWRHDAACQNLADRYFDPWDSDDRDERPNATATQFCATCPVRRACLIEAIANDEPYGTWGGLTRKQRKNLVRARKRVKCPICSGTRLVVTDDHAQLCMSCGIAWRTIKLSRNERRSSRVRQSTMPLSPATSIRTS
jgi:hypothetical protein